MMHLPWDYVYKNSKDISDLNTNRSDTSNRIYLIDQPCKSRNSQIDSVNNENANV